MEIGIIGLGQMGQGMARALLRAGHSVIVHNRTLDRATPLGAAGARIALGIPEVCRGDAVITMLSDDAAVEQVVWGEHGLLDTLAPDQTIHVSMSTISPALVRRLADSHRAHRRTRSPSR
jgi:3-hydroxyisobutyrate dehydrogenase-like beta-hydroxyacid dehydrogenase